MESNFITHELSRLGQIFVSFLSKGKVKSLSGPNRMLLIALFCSVLISIKPVTKLEAQRIELASQETVWLDANNCGPEGPQGAWLCYKIINNNVQDLTNVKITFDGFTGTDSLLFLPPKDSIRNFSILEMSDTIPVYFYVDYSEICDYPTGTGSCVYDGYEVGYSIMVESNENGLLEEERSISTDCLLSASAAGYVESTFVGPGIWIGQILTQTVEYSFGNNENIFFQPGGEKNFPEEAYRLVGSEIIEVSGNVPEDIVGLKDALHYPELSVPGSGGTITIKYYWEVTSINDPFVVHPWAAALSGNKFKYSGYSGSSTFEESGQALQISKSAEPKVFDFANQDKGFGEGIAQWTITLRNTNQDVDIVVDTIRDKVPDCMTLTSAFVVTSDVNENNSASFPEPGSSGKIAWVGNKTPVSQESDFRILAGDSLQLIYQTDISQCLYPASYNNLAYADIGNTSVGPVQGLVSIACQSPDIENPGPQVACDELNLSEILGENLTGNEAYYDNSQENGGQIITEPIQSSMTVWIYDVDLESPECYDEEFFEVLIHDSPILSQPYNETVCDSFNLPETSFIPGENLVSPKYYTNSQASGLAEELLDFKLTSSQTVWIFDSNAADNNCYDEVSFHVAIGVSPVLDQPGDVEICDSYTLSALSQIQGANLVAPKYYNNSQLSGLAEEINELTLTSSQRVWIYDVNADYNSCNDEVSFFVTIHKAPALGIIANLHGCNSYELLPVDQIQGDNLVNPRYYTNSQASALAVEITDLTLTQSQQIWIYDAGTGFSECDDEIHFEVKISSPPVLDYQAIEAACGQDASGEIDLIIVEGEGPFVYLWSATNGNGLVDGQQDQYALTPGLYFVKVIDVNNCYEEIEIQLGDPSDIINIDYEQIHENCFNPGQASINLDVTGGSGTYTYQWAGPEGFNSQEKDISSLQKGQFVVEVQDDKDCWSSIAIDIKEACIEFQKDLDPVDQSYESAGEEIFFTFSLQNTGELILESPTIEDALLTSLPEYLEGDINGNEVMDPGETWKYKGIYLSSQMDVDMGHFVNVARASVYADLNEDGITETNLELWDEVTVEGIRKPSISLLKIAQLPLEDSNDDGYPGFIGDLVEYSFEIINTGNVTLYNISLDDPNALIVGNAIHQLAPGETDVNGFSASLEITSDHIDAGWVINSATVISFTSDLGIPGYDNQPHEEIWDYSDDPEDLEDFDKNDDGNPDDPTEVPVEAYGQVGDFVWMDVNGDGMQTAGEPGVEGVLVQLINESNLVVSNQMTDPAGNFLFDKVKAGKYHLNFDSPHGEDLEITFYRSGSDHMMDNDVNNENGQGSTPWFNLGPGQVDLHLDAGFYKCIDLEGVNWCDFNKNNILDQSENGINGMKVCLYRLVEGEWVLWDSTRTKHKGKHPGVCGSWNMCAMPGTYYMCMNLPPFGLEYVLPGMSQNPFLSSHINNENGMGTTSIFTITGNESSVFVGAGFIHHKE